MALIRDSLERTVEAVVTPNLVDKTQEINTRQRKASKRGLADRFFEKTSTFGAASIQLPLFLVKEFSLARINAYINILLFGGAGFWAALQIKKHFGNFFMMAVPIAILAIAVYKIIQSIMTLSMIFADTKSIKADVKNNFKKIPMFIIKVYRSLIIKQVDIHWMAIIYYIIGGLFILLPTLLNDYTIPYSTITFKFAGLNDKWGVYSIVKYSLVATLVFQIFYIIWVKSRINVINQFYGYEIVPNTEVMEIRKIRHARWRRAVIITVFIVFFVFILIYRFLRRERIIR